MIGEDTEKWSITQNLYYYEASFGDIQVIGTGFQNASENPPENPENPVQMETEGSAYMGVDSPDP